MTRRLIANAKDAKFVPDMRYGAPVEGMTWCNVSYDSETGMGSFLLRMAPGTTSRPHEHMGIEEFFVVSGELVDCDGTVFRGGDFVSFGAGTKHWSTTKQGCDLVVFLRQPNRRLAAGEAVDP